MKKNEDGVIKTKTTGNIFLIVLGFHALRTIGGGIVLITFDSMYLYISIKKSKMENLNPAKKIKAHRIQRGLSQFWLIPEG